MQITLTITLKGEWICFDCYNNPKTKGILKGLTQRRTQLEYSTQDYPIGWSNCCLVLTE